MAFDRKRERELLEKTKRKISQGKRTVDAKYSRKYFVIICEGERTEPLYFQAFQKLLPKSEITLKALGIGCNTLQVVQKAIEYKKEIAPNGRRYDQIWAVFDKDSFSDSDYNEAINLAGREKIRCAYSNQAFELWYLLHFDLQQQAAHRRHYKKMLSTRLGFSYKKNDENVFKALLEKGSQEQAINRAEQLHMQCLVSGDTPSSSNPCTTVYLLVKELNKFIVKKKKNR